MAVVRAAVRVTLPTIPTVLSTPPLLRADVHFNLILLSFHVDPDPLAGVRDLELELRRSLDGQNCLSYEVLHTPEIQVAEVGVALVIVQVQRVLLVSLASRSAMSVWRSACSAVHCVLAFLLHQSNTFQYVGFVINLSLLNPQAINSLVQVHCTFGV